MIKVLVACEESQAVTIEFRKLGVEAFSCDILPASGGHSQWHICGDVTPILKDGWDLVVSFPPCTHLAISGAPHFEAKRKDGRQQAGIDFFMQFTKLQCYWSIENPIGIMGKIYRKPDQIIQPYYFGDPHQKTTCLWLNKLPKLVHNKSQNLFDWPITHTNKPKPIYIEKNGKKRFFTDAISGNRKNTSVLRSKTFPGIAKAMAEQWTQFLDHKNKLIINF